MLAPRSAQLHATRATVEEAAWKGAAGRSVVRRGHSEEEIPTVACSMRRQARQSEKGGWAEKRQRCTRRKSMDKALRWEGAGAADQLNLRSW